MTIWELWRTTSYKLTDVSPSSRHAGAPTARVSILDVAAAAGVSKSAASRALLGQPGASSEVSNHVRKVAARLGYVKDIRAQSLKSTSNRSIAVFVRSVRLSFYGELIAAVQETIEDAGYNLSIAAGSGNKLPHGGNLHALMGSRPAGVIIASGRLPASDIRTIADGQCPVVLAGSPSTSRTVGSVADDNSGAVEMSLRVAASGHRRVGVVTTSPTRSSTLGTRSQRLQQELQALGIEPVTIPIESKTDVPRQASLRRAAEQVTVIMCPNDPILVSTWEMLQSWGLRVPEDISLTGYDGIGQLASPVFGLTTWRQPVEEIGHAAARQLLARITDPSTPATHEFLTGSYIPGRTLAPASTLHA